MTMGTKTRRGRKAENNAEIRVRLNAKTKRQAEKLFRQQGLSTSDGMRMLINRAIEERDPWFAHDNSSHIPNAGTQRALMADVMPLPEGGLAELWNGE